jgi:hypothetical protein
MLEGGARNSMATDGLNKGGANIGKRKKRPAYCVAKLCTLEQACMKR